MTTLFTYRIVSYRIVFKSSERQIRHRTNRNGKRKETITPRYEKSESQNLPLYHCIFPFPVMYPQGTVFAVVPDTMLLVDPNAQSESDVKGGGNVEGESGDEGAGEKTG